MLADDIAGVTLSQDGKPLVLPAFPQLKLWSDSAEELDYPRKQLQPVRPGHERFSIDVVDQFCAEATPLRHIFQLKVSNKDELRLEPVEDSWRFGPLLGNTYHARFLDGLRMRAPHFQLLSEVANQVPVTRVIRPSFPNRLPEMMEMIEEDLDKEQS